MVGNGMNDACSFVPPSPPTWAYALLSSSIACASWDHHQHKQPEIDHDHSTRHDHDRDYGCHGSGKGTCSVGHHHHGRPADGDAMKETLMHENGCADVHGRAETWHCCSYDHAEMETHCCSHGHGSTKVMEEEDRNTNQVICDIETGQFDVHSHQDHLQSCANDTCCTDH